MVVTLFIPDAEINEKQNEEKPANVGLLFFFFFFGRIYESKRRKMKTLPINPIEIKVKTTKRSNQIKSNRI